MKKIAFAAGALVIGGLLAVPTAAFAAPGDPYPSTISSNTAAPGAAVTFTAETGQPEGTSATATLTGDQAAEGGSITPASTLSKNFSVGANGNLRLAVKIPANATAGAKYSFAVSAGSFSTTETITAAVGGTAEQLSYTGANAAPFVWLGAGLLAIGAAFVAVFAIKRRNRSSVRA